ncbi:neutral/alkaline non-lysosomal ceramidase N-terminal domain-containing protein [Aquiflexum sp.]|uniref:neutral/alkaline non-lysosomal ceramidase N-terminal domain-containing protein n=1 Tax=Aquiflexum sp. TaxID=1872584 RepID=UPI00359449E8
MKKWLKVSLILLVVIAIIFVSYTLYQFRDRHKGHEVDLKINSSHSSAIKAGFSKVDITPIDFDTWTDNNGDAHFNEKDGDVYQDLNGNGKFDPIYLAGFHHNRPASGVNDPLWARTMVLDDGKSRLALCVIDMIGFGHDEVVRVRKRLKESLGIDYLIISSTHVHSSPDLMGMWGVNEYSNGVNPDYLEFVMKGILESVENATNVLEPVYFRFAIDEEAALPMVGDTRDPQVYDAAIRIMQVMASNDDRTLGTIMNWGNHPETLWSGNTLISSDFPHYFREYVENGIVENDSLQIKGVGGISIFLNGALGGLMTTHPSIPIVNPYSGEVFQEENNGKIDAQGKALAKIVLEKLADKAVLEVNFANLNIRAKTVELSLENKLFKLAAWIGIFKRGLTSWWKIRSEVAVWTMGPASFVHIPGELYPEILNGGVESPEGADFGIEPVEVPAIRSVMPGQFRFFNGMSNDMIGYIVPKSQWDEKPPFTYGKEKRPYGEINSLGPETAPLLHKLVLELLEDLK